MVHFLVSGQPFKLRSRAKLQSPLLAKCAESEESSTSEKSIDIPLKFEWVKLWDKDVPLASLSQEQLLGVIKV